MKEPPPFDPPPERPKEMPIEDHLQVLIDAVERIGQVRIRHCGRSAFIHLRKSWILHPVDSEMSMFRALTAEEEAASALIRALKQQRYPGAERLNAQDHVHKAAMWPILEAIARSFIDKGMPTPVILIKKEGRPAVEVHVDIAALIGREEPFWVQPVPPFHGVMHSDTKGPFEVHRWERELGQIAGGVDIADHIRGEANRRNQILYASDAGVPATRFADDFILLRLERVKWIMVAVIGILQTKEYQLLVVQALEAVLIGIRRFEGQGYAFPAHQRPEGAHLHIEQQPDGSFASEFSDCGQEATDR